MKASLRISMVFFLCLFAMTGRAAEPNLSLQMIGTLSRFMADIQLSMYEPENSEFRDSAHASWAALQRQYQTWLMQLGEDDHRASQTVWEELVETVAGDGRFEGLLDTGFDAALNASLRLQVGNLRALVLKQQEMSATSLSPLQSLWSRNYRTLAGYMLVATTPLGGMSVGADDMDLSPVHMVQETDKAWERALQAATPAQKGTLTRAHRRWEFIRETVVNAAQRSLPYVVNTQMSSMIRDVERLIDE